jgi:hypothetical protein
MSDTELALQEARLLNRGLMEDNAALQRDLAERSAALAATEQRLEDVTAHRDRLLGEKEQFNQWTCGGVS